MNNKSIILISALFGLIVFGMILFAYQFSASSTATVNTPILQQTQDVDSDMVPNELPVDAVTPTENTTQPAQSPPVKPDSNISTDAVNKPNDSFFVVQATRRYVNNVHIVNMSTVVPNGCFQFEYETMVAESFPEQVQVDVRIYKAEGMCTQAIETISESIEFAVSENASFLVLYNDERINIGYE